MERLTSNKDVSEMSMYELAYNSCYAKAGNARVRDFESDFDARELAIKLLEKYADIPNEFTCGEEADDFMSEGLIYGTDNIFGVIAVFYMNLWTKADLREGLKYYEDLEERLRAVYGECNGLLEKVVEQLERHEGIDLPVPVFKSRLLTDGEVDQWEEFKGLEEQGKLLKLPCAVGDTVYTIYSDEDGSFIEEPKVEEVSTHRIWIDSMYFDYSDIGKTIFLTKEAAEAALKKREAGNGA